MRDRLQRELEADEGDVGNAGQDAVTGRPTAEGELRFVCTTPGCSWSAWIAARFDPDGPARDATIRSANRPTCPAHQWLPDKDYRS